MFFVYILKSKKDGKFYTGSTSDLKRRVKEHNAGKVTSTKHRLPFVLQYYEAMQTEDEAKKREYQLKENGRAFGGLKRRMPITLG